MAWPPTERDILEVARDSYLTAGVTIPDMGFGSPAGVNGERLVITDCQMAESKVPNNDEFVMAADKHVTVFDPKYTEPLVEKGLLDKHEGKYCTLYTLTNKGAGMLENGKTDETI